MTLENGTHLQNGIDQKLLTIQLVQVILNGLTQLDVIKVLVAEH